MARKEETRRNDWSCESGYCSEDEEERFLEGFHLDYFPLVTKGAEFETCSSQGEGEGKVE